MLVIIKFLKYCLVLDFSIHIACEQSLLPWYYIVFPHRSVPKSKVNEFQSETELSMKNFRFYQHSLLVYFALWLFQDAVSAATDEERLIKIHDVIQQLPPPHYR